MKLNNPERRWDGIIDYIFVVQKKAGKGEKGSKEQMEQMKKE